MANIMKDYIYLDNAATTRVYPEVIQEMLPYFTEFYGNPAAVYSFAGVSKSKVEKARREIASSINALPKEIYFTSGGSESDNWALIATAEAKKEQGKHIITTKIEHHGILHTCEYLEKRGYEITYLEVDQYGLVSLDELEKNIRPDTILISVMTANNEIGTLEPIQKIGKIAHKHNVLFHTDAVQAYLKVDIDVKEMNIDMLSVSGHKVHGPKGIGFLYINEKAKIPAFIHGGAQERQRRAGTHNVPGIVGMGKAVEIAERNMLNNKQKIEKLREHLIKRVLNEVPNTILNGHPTKRVSNIVSFSFKNIEGEMLLIMLDQYKICVSSGSACTAGSIDPSHVLLAIGKDKKAAKSTIRLSLSDENTIEEIDFTVDKIKEIVNRLRNMSLS